MWFCVPVKLYGGGGGRKGLANENVTLLSMVTQVLNFQQCFTKSLHDGESSCETKTPQKFFLGNSLIAPWLGLHALLRWALVQTLVRVLRSQKPRGVIFFFLSMF